MKLMLIFVCLLLSCSPAILPEGPGKEKIRADGGKEMVPEAALEAPPDPSYPRRLGESCISSRECMQGLICPITTQVCTDPESCEKVRCKDTQKCFDGRCIDIYDPMGPGQSCIRDDNCYPTLRCMMYKGEPLCFTPQCLKDSHCSDEKKCKEYWCVTPP